MENRGNGQSWVEEHCWSGQGRNQVVEPYKKIYTYNEGSRNYKFIFINMRVKNITIYILLVSLFIS
jgi:hypothetical protein